VAVDPRSADEIAATTQAWIRAHVPGGEHAAWISPLTPAAAGMATFIWFGWLGGAGLPEEYWRRAVALRVFATEREDPVLARESAILEFVAAAGYAVPRPLATARAADADNPVGLPWMLMPRVPGRPLLEVLATAPWAAGARLRELAALQVALHRIPVAGCPLPADGALVDRWLDDKREQIEGPGDVRANALLARLRRRADVVRDEVPVVCHGDFHPLNVLSRPLGSGWEHVVIDWTDSVVGDRHYDVARTVALFRVASIAAGSTAERLALKAAGPWLARTYRRAYERALAVDPARFAYWTAAHLLRGWAQIVGLHTGLYADGPGRADDVPLAVAEALLIWATAELDALG
jgi:aminoglycoside phosphotransferase (APT) family kinase protein